MVYTLQYAVSTVFAVSVIGFLMGFIPYVFGLGINAIIKILKKA